MLEDLDRIDWSRLSHAYGPATNVPALIRQLEDDSSEVRQVAEAELFSTIWHQGTVYDATAYAVPFLIELATDTSVPDRSHVVELLRAIAQGWVDWQKYAAVRAGKFDSAETAERKARERRHQQAAHSAIAEGLTALSALLSDQEAEVRVFTAFLLVLLIGHAAEVAERLLEAADREEDDVHRSMLQFALVTLAQDAANPAVADVVVRRLTSAFEEPSSEVAELGAGLALLQLGQAEAIARVLDLARRRLVSESHLFQTIDYPGSTSLYWLVNGSLEFAPREQLKWIVEGLSHTDREVRRSAMGCGTNLCEEFRWGPGELAPVYAQLIERVDADERKLVLQYLRSMGAAGAAVLETFQQHRLADVRENAAVQLKRIEADRQQRESRLVEKRPDPLPSVAELLKTIEADQGSRKWHDGQLRDAVIQLGFHGPRAHPAVESLRAIAQHENPWMRAHAISALWRITQSADLVVPLVQANLDPEPAVFLLLDCLKQMGTVADALAPQLRRLVDSPKRFFPRGCGDPCGQDETFCDACAAALNATTIRPPRTP